jgi:two-component system chemotaxis response regulator CheB
MIKILIVDDSETEIQILKAICAQQKDMEIVGCARNGKEAIAMTTKLKPDLITMDIQMPVLDGIAATQYIMSHQPTPIVVISSKLSNKILNMSFRALEAGALTVLDKPHNITSEKFEHERLYIVDTLRSMAEIKVIKKRFHFKKSAKETQVVTPSELKNRRYEVVVIGASVGGPQALKKIFSSLTVDFPLPIVVVQHIAPDFIGGFTCWLNNNTLLGVKEAEDFEPLHAGTIYFAPDNYHLEINRNADQLMTRLVAGAPVSGFCPSITTLFHSTAKTCGKNAIGLLLTGMGEDGAAGLLALKLASAHTIIQDQESAVVFGMAGVAQSLGAVDKVVELDKIAEYLLQLNQNSTR